MAAYIFDYHYGGKGATVTQKPGILLNTLQCTRQFPTTKDYQAQNVNNAQAVKP